jgi:hypothetical protein
VSEQLVQVRYDGLIVISARSTARLHDRGDVKELLWEAIGKAGWHGETARLRPTIAFVIRIPPAPGPRRAPASRPSTPPLTGRRFIEGGTTTRDGIICHRYEGPLLRRAVGAGVPLIRHQWEKCCFSFIEDMIYTAAIRAGWLSVDDANQTVAVPAAQITIRVARHRS